MRKDRYDFLKDALVKYTKRPNFNIDLETGEMVGLSKFTTPDGYYRVSMCHKHKKKQFYLHEIIAVYGGLDVVDKTINHIDGNKKNNSIHNLEGLSMEENRQHAVDTGLMASGSRNGNSKLTEELVIEIKTRFKNGQKTPQISKELGVNYFTLRNIGTGRTWGHIQI